VQRIKNQARETHWGGKKGPNNEFGRNLNNGIQNDVCMSNQCTYKGPLCRQQSAMIACDDNTKYSKDSLKAIIWRIQLQTFGVVEVEYSGTTYDTIHVIMLTIVPPFHVVVMVKFGNHGHFGKLLSKSHAHIE
jgi:hypothetical protein